MMLKLPPAATRAADLDMKEGVPSGAPSDSRVVEISFSSPEPYRRGAGEDSFFEVLGHGEGEVDLTRLNSGAAPLLKDHMPTIDAQIGVVERAWIDGERGRARVRFSETPDALSVLARVRAGDLSCVSVGYGIRRAVKMGEAEGLPVVRVSWTPKEISFVAIPADPTVGYGRAEGTAANPITVEQSEDAMSDPIQNPAPATPNPAPQATRTAVPVTPAPQEMSADDLLSAERRRAEEIGAIAGQFDMPDHVVRKAQRDGTSVDAFRKLVMDHIASPEADALRGREARIGLSESEVKRYSLVNAVRVLMNPTDANRKAAGFEIEASRAVSDKIGSEPGGLYLPADVLMDGDYARSQNTGTATAGGVLVAQDYRAGSFIELLRNRMALAGVGVRILQGLTGNVDIPKRTGASTMYFVDEDVDVTESDGAFGLVGMTPHTAGVATAITRRMMQQGSPDIEALVRDDLLTSLTLGLDKTALVGHSSPSAPNGVRDLVIGDALPFTGPFATFEELVDLETAVASANADVDSMAYIYNAATSGHFKKTLEFAGVSGTIERGGQVNGYNRVKSNQITTAGEVAFGNWSDVVIGMWSGLDLRVDTSTKAASDGKVLRVFTDIDVALRNVESIKWGVPA